jgi:hypothetical protein
MLTGYDIAAVKERQRLEELNYSSGNPVHLYEIEIARERIRSVLKMMGIRS